MLEKTYDPKAIEGKWYQHWESNGAFDSGTRPDAEPFSIVLPPPNVTGSLHIGHALDHTLQDILIRFERLRGKDVLWQPGTDHAGIATQMVVERQLEAQGIKRHDLGRDKFLERVWEWKAESGGTITRQMRRLGASCDWKRERFTMDEGFSKAVIKVFVELHKQGLIYRDKRLVNWDPKFKTAISDLEVEQREIDGNFWHLRYPVEGMEGRFITVATTRPETMLGDSAVAVNAEDERYKDIIGKFVRLPLVGRLIPIVADEHADPEQGSGAVKITPAHDFNDFEVGKRHGLRQINILDDAAHILDGVAADESEIPEAYRGLNRYDARKAIVADLDALGLLEKVEPRRHVAPYGDRSGVVIEPWLTDQWYVNAAELAKDAIAAVESGATKFAPKNWDRTFFEWMRNIQPWCVSRQLWWGHQIPAWYAPDGSIYVATSEAEAQAQAGAGVVLTRDNDVLDTWFSSALWPFGTLGWPEKTAELARYYPTSVLVTAFDIIFFWVARMMMDGLHFMGEVPFKTVYIHALVRDENGQKMSKSKGNVIDPLEFADKYGADALRFTLASLESQGRDIRLAEKRVEGYRNFATKLWNAARFLEMNGCQNAGDFDPASATHVLNQWIISEVVRTAAAVTTALDTATLRFDVAAKEVYEFTWGMFCDWYVELTKPILMGDDEAAKAETQKTAAWVYDRILTLLHPFMPFVTEELWHATAETRASDLILSAWPTGLDGLVNEQAVAEVDWLIKLITDIRSVRAEMNVPAGAKVPVLVQDAGEATKARLQRTLPILTRLARLESITQLDGPAPKGSVQTVIDEATYHLPLAGVIDIDQERARLEKTVAKHEGEIKSIDGRLGNEAFVAKAPDSVVAENRARREELVGLVEKLGLALRRLG
ncbi:valine--tRNA ligase [Govanella unica]|uniref:Valine--tRNA ligase n=1 Tax=Govanella unica TaxID=2975056 RepID=A0A9X3TX36_9PROT|nr:valine--tRNA ligase [Govania unica]MDA5193287.1 valine--tRNA ligase [Govania unica]